VPKKEAFFGLTLSFKKDLLKEIYDFQLANFSVDARLTTQERHAILSYWLQASV